MVTLAVATSDSDVAALTRRVLFVPKTKLSRVVRSTSPIIVFDLGKFVSKFNVHTRRRMVIVKDRRASCYTGWIT